MTKNQFLALKPGDRVKCVCGYCWDKNKSYTVTGHYGTTKRLVGVINEFGSTTTLDIKNIVREQ